MQILAGIFLLGVLIAFHELGHFLFAKMLGVRVLVFSIGFGPKIFSFTKGHTEYRLSAIPLGGYVRMFGESLEQDLTEEEKKYSFLHQATWKKSLIAFAGPLFNFILPVILLFFLIVGQEQIFLPKIGSFTPDSIAQKSGLKTGDLVKEIDGEKIDSFSDLAQVILENPNKKLNFLIERKVDDKNTLLNINVTPQEQSDKAPFEKETKVGRIGIMPAILRPMVFVLQSSPLKSFGLKNSDEIVQIKGQEISSYDDLMADLPSLLAGTTLKVSRVEQGKESLVELQTQPLSDADYEFFTTAHRHSSFVVKEELIKSEKLIEDEQRKIASNFGIASAKGLVTEVKSGSIASNLKIQPQDLVIGINGEQFISSAHLLQNFMSDFTKEHLLAVIKSDGRGEILGVKFKANIEKDMGLDADMEKLLGLKVALAFKAGEIETRKVNILQAFSRSVKQTFEIGVMTAKSFLMLVKMQAPASQLGGPIMLFDVANQAAQKGLAYYLMVMCMLSVNLGILNLLPIPALDGGHLLLFGIEAIQRKPLTPKTRTIATQIGFALLLFIMMFALFNDITRLFS